MIAQVLFRNACAQTHGRFAAVSFVGLHVYQCRCALHIARLISDSQEDSSELRLIQQANCGFAL